MLRREVGAMGKLHSQLALFGSIDDEVIRRNDPRTTAMVERFLPGTTGYGQRGWFTQLRNFVDRVAGKTVDFPTQKQALLDLAQPAHRIRPIIRPENITGDLQIIEEDDADPVTGPRILTITPQVYAQLYTEGITREPPPQPPPQDRLITSTLARAVYAGAVLAKIQTPEAVEPPSTTRKKLAWPGRVLLEFQRAGDPIAEDPLSSLLELATYRAPGIRTLLPFAGPPVRRMMAESTLLESGRPAWQPFVRQQFFLDPRIAEYPPPCTGVLRTVKGEVCAVLTTEMDAAYTLDQVKSILEPQNWDQSLPTFFCNMQPEPGDDSNWSRVLECVSTECSEYKLQTPLKYWKGPEDAEGIYLNYDLDIGRRRADTLVEIDSGYIWITRNHAGGVKIRTSKALKICGLSPTATAALACFSGWAQVGIDMVTNAAAGPIEGTVDFFPSAPVDVGSDPRVGLMSRTSPTSPVAPPEADEPEARLPDLPHGFRQDLIEDTAEQADRYVEVTTRLAKVFIRRWKDGLTRDDVHDLGDLFGRTMTGLAVGAFDSVMGNFRPKPKPQPTTRNERNDE
jgi:hypothetical protein